MSQFLLNLAQATLTTSAVILLLLLLGPLLSRRYAVRWRYWAWLAVAVRLLIPIDFSLPQAPVQLETPPDRVVYTTAPSPVLQAPATSNLPTPPAASPSSPSVPSSIAPEESVGAETVKALTLSQVLFWIWLAGALLLLAWHLAGYLRFRRYLRRWAQPMEPPAFLPGLLRELREQGESFGMQAVVEIFDTEDLQLARQSGARIIQVNARDLETFAVDSNACLELIRRCPPEGEERWIAASGLSRTEHLRAAAEVGYDAVLIGTALMEQKDPGVALRRLLRGQGG